MSLSLGKSFNRNYNIRLPFLNAFYDIGLFFNTKSSFLLFSVGSSSSYFKEPIKINMFKNLEASKFCETFLDLHQYRGKNLDIMNQVKSIKDEQVGECIQILNENINISKYTQNDKSFFDALNIYCYTISGYENNIFFLIAERQHIVSRISKKIVRTTGIQIATNIAYKSLIEYHEEYLKYSKTKNL